MQSKTEVEGRYRRFTSRRIMGRTAMARLGVQGELISSTGCVGIMGVDPGGMGGGGGYIPPNISGGGDALYNHPPPPNNSPSKTKKNEEKN